VGPALLNASVPEVQRLGHGPLLTGNGGEGQDRLHIVEELGLVVFDQHHLVLCQRCFYKLTGYYSV
jgi:hypothetical protein